ncbi:MAG: glycosyltransferase family 39 protein [Clostridia bacterium]|nr:glycosyltransferase family 39 protein [Clostridia bacterium]
MKAACLREYLKENKLIIAVLLVSFILRVLFSIDNVKALFIDITAYEGTATTILKTGIFSVGTYHAPGYPFFIAAVYSVFGYSYFNVYIAQSILGTLSTLLIYLIAANVFDKRIGKISALVSLLYWPLTLYSGILLSETLFLFLLLAGVYTFIKGISSHKTLYFLLCGGLLALSALVRSINLMALIIIPAVYLFIGYRNYKAVLKNIAAFALVFCITMSPWPIRNYAMFGKFIPVDSLGGLNLYIGNNGRSNGYFVNVSKDPLFNIDKYINNENRLEKAAIRDEILKKAAVSYIVTHPERFVKLTLKRAALFVIDDFRGVDWILVTYMAQNRLFQHIPWQPLIYYSNIAFFILAVFGLLNFMRNKKAIVFIVLILYYFATTSVFYISSRYRLPIMPFMAIAAAFSFDKILVWGQRFRSRVQNTTSR